MKSAFSMRMMLYWIGTPLRYLTHFPVSINCNKYWKNMASILKTQWSPCQLTGHYWLVPYSCLFELGFDIKFIKPLATDALRKMRIRKVKTKRIDAEIVVKVLMFGENQETSVANIDAMLLRQLYCFTI